MLRRDKSYDPADSCSMGFRLLHSSKAFSVKLDLKKFHKQYGWGTSLILSSSLLLSFLLSFFLFLKSFFSISSFFPPMKIVSAGKLLATHGCSLLVSGFASFSGYPSSALPNDDLKNKFGHAKHKMRPAAPRHEHRRSFRQHICVCMCVIVYLCPFHCRSLSRHRYHVNFGGTFVYIWVWL